MANKEPNFFAVEFQAETTCSHVFPGGPCEMQIGLSTEISLQAGTGDPLVAGMDLFWCNHVMLTAKAH